MKWSVFFIITFWILGCSEPFEFDVTSTAIDVIDAKVSTLEGRSFVRIYSDNGIGGIQEHNDLDVRIENESGDEFLFSYTNDSLHYQPISTDFKGEVGLSYKLTVYRQEQLIYESAYDLITPSIDFNVLTADTTVATYSSGSIVNQKGTVVLADIASSKGQYGKFDFRYFYEDYFSKETVEVNDIEKFALFSCDSNMICPDSTEVEVAITLREKWYFFKNTAFCNYVRDTSDFLEFTQNCERYYNCCNVEEEWLAQLEVTSESLSPEVYDFWRKVEKLNSNNGLIRDTYPFPLKGNVRSVNGDEQVIGIFRAVSEISKNRFIEL